jgi:hypothetical protein
VDGGQGTKILYDFAYCARAEPGRNHGVVQACGPTTRSLANTTFRRSHTTMSAASKRATIIAWGTLDGMKTVC